MPLAWGCGNLALMGDVIDKVDHSLCPKQRLVLLPAVDVFSDEKSDDNNYTICRKQ